MFGAPGLTAHIRGDANDYFGKGLSGAKLILQPPENAGYRPHEQVIVGNVALYGATRGEVYVRGRAGERFGVRNSGVNAVVEGLAPIRSRFLALEDGEVQRLMARGRLDAMRAPALATTRPSSTTSTR